jgi:hypothetical protein
MGRTLREELVAKGKVKPEDAARLRALAEAAAAKDRERRFRQELLAKLPWDVRQELQAWEVARDRQVPREVLVAWSHLDERGQVREWAKWLAAAREVAS